MNNFNLQKFLIENKMTRNSRLLNENQDILRRIWEKTVEDNKESFQEFPHMIEDPEVVDNYEYFVQNAKYGNIEELAKSLNDTWVSLSHEDSDFGDFIVYLIRICKEMNFKDTGELVKACINFYYGDYYNDEEKEEYYNDFKDEL
jgi:hypothetical protein